MRKRKKPFARLWAGEPEGKREQEGKHHTPLQTAMRRHRGGHVRRGSGIGRFGDLAF